MKSGWSSRKASTWAFPRGPCTTFGSKKCSLLTVNIDQVLGNKVYLLPAVYTSLIMWSINTQHRYYTTISWLNNLFWQVQSSAWSLFAKEMCDFLEFPRHDHIIGSNRLTHMSRLQSKQQNKLQEFKLNIWIWKLDTITDTHANNIIRVAKTSKKKPDFGLIWTPRAINKGWEGEMCGAESRT